MEAPMFLVIVLEHLIPKFTSLLRVTVIHRYQFKNKSRPGWVWFNPGAQDTLYTGSQPVPIEFLVSQYYIVKICLKNE